MTSTNEFTASISTRSFFRFCLGIVLLLIGWAAIYDIRPMLEETATFAVGLQQTMDIGPFTGDIGVNFVGSLFVYAGLVTMYNFFKVTVYTLYANPDYFSIQENGITVYEVQKKDIQLMRKSGMVGYDKKFVVKTFDDEFIFRSFDKMLLYKAWSYFVHNGYPVGK